MEDSRGSASTRLVIETTQYPDLTLHFDPAKGAPAADGKASSWELTGVCYRPDAKLAAIELRDNASVLPATISLGLASPKVGAQFPGAPGSDAARFQLAFGEDIASNRPWFHVRAIFEDGEQLDIARVHLLESLASPVSAPYVSTVLHGGQRFRFYIAEENDEIQGRHHANGVFYEIGVLEYLKDICPARQMILDIGANVGNHAIYFEKIMRAREVVAFEPNTPARMVMRKNIALNGCDAINMRYAHFAVGDASGEYKAGELIAANWGGTSLAPDPDGAIQSRRIDDLLGGFRVAMMKIDVEGMEAAVLRGAAGMIAAAAPIIVVEVTPETVGDVGGLLDGWQYRIERTFSMYPDIATLVAVPAGIFPRP